MKRITRKAMVVGKPFAERMLQINTLPEQKSRFKPQHAEKILRIMERDEFRSTEICVAKVIIDGQHTACLVNGQHTMTALAAHGGSIDIIYEEYEVEDMVELSKLFRQYDPSWSSRKLNQLISFEAHAREIGWPRKTPQLLISALCLINKDVYAMSSDEKVDLIQYKLKEGSHIASVIYDDNKKLAMHMARAPVCAAILLTFEKSRSDSLNFWSSVRDGEGLLKTDSAWHVREFLKNSRVRNYAATPQERKFKNGIVTHHETIARCIYGWNAYRRNESLRVLKYLRDKPIPRPI